MAKDVQTYKNFADRKRSPGATLEVGDLVYLSSKNIKTTSPCSSLLPRRTGLYPILQKVGEVVYQLKFPESWKIHDVFHQSLLMKKKGKAKKRNSRKGSGEDKLGSSL